MRKDLGNDGVWSSGLLTHRFTWSPGQATFSKLLLLCSLSEAAVQVAPAEFLGLVALSQKPSHPALKPG